MTWFAAWPTRSRIRSVACAARRSCSKSELDSDELKEYTHIIIQEADRLQELVNRMLGPNRRPTYAPVNIHNVLERVRTLVLAETGERISDRCVTTIPASRSWSVTATS